MDNKVNERDIYQIAWNYFQQHASQRIGYFNFFLLFSSFITAAIIAVMKDASWVSSILGISLGLLQLVVSYIFWKIDERNKYLTKNGEAVIKQIEAHFNINNDADYSKKLGLFSIEEERTAALRQKEALENKKLGRQISHSKSFKYIFISFGSLGLIEIILSLIILFALL